VNKHSQKTQSTNIAYKEKINKVAQHTKNLQNHFEKKKKKKKKKKKNTKNLK